MAGCELGSPTGVTVPVFSNAKPVPATGSDAPAPSSGAVSGESAITPLAKEQATRLGVPSGLVLAVISQESGFQAHAVSPVGAQGLMQLMPSTIQDINRAGVVAVLDPFDSSQNIGGGTWYLSWVRKQLPADKVVAGEEWKLALGGYNGGIGRVRAAIDKALQGAPINPRVRWDDIAAQMPAETRRYVPAVVAKWDVYGR